METFAIPGVGGLIERVINNKKHILIQQRVKQDPHCKLGMLEIPAGKVRAFENVYDCLRREVLEETGLKVTYIVDEDKSKIYEAGSYKVVNYKPFSCSQNIKEDYPIMVEVFICQVTGDFIVSSDEARDFKWVSVTEIGKMLNEEADSFYPMHVSTLRKYYELYR